MSVNFDDFKILEGNDCYRISDVFYERMNDLNFEKLSSEILTNLKYKNSILQGYLKKKKKVADIEAFRSSVIEWGKLNKGAIPDSNELVIHLRLGDVMKTYCTQGVDASFFQKLFLHSTYKRVRGHYLSLDKWFDLDPNRYEKVSLVGSLHFHSKKEKYLNLSELIKKNNEIVNILANYFEKKGKTVKIVSNKNPDADFYYLFKSKIILHSSSNFSKLASGLQNEHQEKFYLSNRSDEIVLKYPFLSRWSELWRRFTRRIKLLLTKKL